MFQEFGAKVLKIENAEPNASATTHAELIARYPHLSEIEVARLINLYRELSALDVALMISDEKLGPKLDHFFKDHRHKIRTPLKQYAALVVTGVVGIAVIAWAVAFGG